MNEAARVSVFGEGLCCSRSLEFFPGRLFAEAEGFLSCGGHPLEAFLEVLIALVRQLSKAEVARLSHIANGITKFDAAALRHAAEVVRSVVERKSAAA